MRKTLILAAIAALAFSSAAQAKSCKDEHGKFVRCPPPAAAPAAPAPTTKAAPCKDAKGHFIKCATPPAAKPAAHSGGLFGHKPTPAPAPAPAAAPAAPQVASTAGAPHCKKGKPCGHSCIAMDKVCHK